MDDDLQDDLYDELQEDFDFDPDDLMLEDELDDADLESELEGLVGRVQAARLSGA